jgi:DNA-binding transcriptional regulator YiaG
VSGLALTSIPALPTPEERKQIRKAAGVTQSDLARALDVNFAAVSHWENGRATPRGRNLRVYLEALDQMRGMGEGAGNAPASR